MNVITSALRFLPILMIGGRALALSISTTSNNVFVVMAILLRDAWNTLRNHLDVRLYIFLNAFAGICPIYITTTEADAITRCVSLDFRQIFTSNRTSLYISSLLHSNSQIQKRKHSNYQRTPRFSTGKY